MKSLFLFLNFSLSAVHLFAQSLSGLVVDAYTKAPLPYASVSILNSLGGTMTNEDGYFELKNSEEKDSIVISYMGYEDQQISFENKRSPITVSLKTWEFQLDEVMVRSLSPLEYLKKAIATHSATISDQPFETRGFFAECSSIENDNSESINQVEAVIKSYFPNYSDTSVTTLNQLALYREKTEGDFRSEFSEPKKSRKRRERERKDRDRKEKNYEKLPERETEAGMDIDIDGLTDGGSVKILDTAQDFISLPFLQEENFKKIKYSFGENAFYTNRTLIVVDFQARRKIETVAYSGSIYLNYEDLAFVALRYEEDVKIPFLVKAFIRSIFGIKIEHIHREVRIKNQENAGFWYPKEIITDTKLALRQNDLPEVMKAKKMFSIDEIITENPESIPKEKLFNPAEGYKGQVRKIEGLNWENVNVVN